MSWQLFALGAALAIVVRDLAHKKALFTEHSLEMLVARGFFIIPLLFLLAFFVRIDVSLSTLAWLYLGSILATTGILFRIRGLRHLDVSVAAPLQNMNPLFLLLIAGLFLGEEPTMLHLAGILLIVIGTYILEGGAAYPGLLGPLRHLLRDPYAWIIIASAFLLSVSQTLDKWLLTDVPVVAYLFWVWLFINLNFLLVHLLRFKWRGLERDVVRDWKWLGLAAVMLFIQMLCYYNAVARGPIILILPITRLSALGLVLVGGRLFHEEALLRRSSAALLMIAGALLILKP